MMRHAFTLASLGLLVLLTTRLTLAQEISFHGSDVVQLAKTIAAEAARTNQLPAAYSLPMANGHTATITAPNAFELLVRATVGRNDNSKTFPAEISLQITDLTIPASDPRYEPEMDGIKIPVFTAEIDEKARYWQAIAEAPGHKLFTAMKFGVTQATTYRLTAAQIIVAMAVLIDDIMSEKKIPLAIAVPLVHSPSDWTDTSKPVVVGAVTAGQADTPPPLIQPDLRITVQGIELSERGPVPGDGQMAPFCGVIRIELTGYGPITKIRLLLDGVERKEYDGLGPNYFDLNTLTLTDGPHTLAATSIDADGKNYAYIFSFPIANGRESGFSPAETDVTVARNKQEESPITR